MRSAFLDATPGEAILKTRSAIADSAELKWQLLTHHQPVILRACLFRGVALELIQQPGQLAQPSDFINLGDITLHQEHFFPDG